jgi:hypothetical protein
MAENGIDALRSQLRADPPDSIRRLTPGQLADFTAAIAEAKRRQAEALEDTDQLEHVVSLLTDDQLQDAVERARAAGLLEQLVPLASSLPGARVAGAAS